LKQPTPVQKDKFSLPLIPAKPLIRFDDKADFVTRNRNVDDALRRSMDVFVKVNKLTIKNATAIDRKVDEKLRENEKTSESPIDRNDIKIKSRQIFIKLSQIISRVSKRNKNL
jgi:hypothetical protein